MPRVAYAAFVRIRIGRGPCRSLSRSSLVHLRANDPLAVMGLEKHLSRGSLLRTLHSPRSIHSTAPLILTPSIATPTMTSKPYPFPYAWTYKEVTGSWRSTSHTTHIIPVGEKNDVILQFWPQKDGSTVTHCDVRGLDNRPHFIIKHKPSKSDKKLVFQYDCPKDGYKDFATFKYSSRTFKIPADSDSQPLTAKFSVVHM